VYENEQIACVLDIEPFNEGHLLILPKHHFHDIDEIDEMTLKEIMSAVVKMSRILKEEFHPDGITICQNGGIFNDLGHFHMHVIPRFKGDGFSWSDPVLEHHAKTRLKETKEKLKNRIESKAID
jgi:diadenosine tetraphosphate (Ap4A) HIT family hydrolase